MIELYKFLEQVGKGGTDYTKPPYRVPADELDKNFAKVAPAETQGEPPAYRIDATDEGWILLPQVVFDVCENGQPTQWRFCAQRV